MNKTNQELTQEFYLHFNAAHSGLLLCVSAERP